MDIHQTPSSTCLRVVAADILWNPVTLSESVGITRQHPRINCLRRLHSRSRSSFARKWAEALCALDSLTRRVFHHPAIRRWIHDGAVALQIITSYLSKIALNRRADRLLGIAFILESWASFVQIDTIRACISLHILPSAQHQMFPSHKQHVLLLHQASGWLLPKRLLKRTLTLPARRNAPRAET